MGVKGRARRAHIDLHTPEFFPEPLGRFDAERAAGILKAANVNAVNFFAKCHYGNCYYDKKVGHRHIGMKGDMLGEMVEACQKVDIALHAYYSLGVDMRAVEQNPDWEMLDPEGKPNSLIFRMPCFNSPYVEELVLPQMEELARGYDLEGVWFDFSRGGYCSCRYCEEKFKRDYGRAMPKDEEEPLAREYLQWRRQVSLNLEREIHSVVRGIKPGMEVAGNHSYSMREPFRPEPSVTYLSLDPPTSEPQAVNYSLDARYLDKCGLPFEVITTRFHEGWGDWTIKPAAQLKLEMATILANGGLPNIGDQMSADGTLDEAAWEKIGEALAYVKEREGFCLETESVPYIAVLNGSQRVMAFRPDVGGLANWENLKPVRGAHKALVESGFHFDILNEDNLVQELPRYKALILPDQVGLRSETLGAIREFVAAGGVLLATHRTSLLHEKGGFAGDFLLGDVLGVKFSGYSAYSTGYVAIAEEALWGEIPRSPMPVKGTFIKVVPQSARVVARLRYPITENTPDRFFSWRQPPAGRDSGYPAATMNQFGKGKAIYIAAELFSAFFDRNYPWHRHFIRNCLDYALEEKVLEVECPPSVEVSLRRQGKVTILHLISYHEEKRIGGAEPYGGERGFPTVETVPVIENIRARVLLPGVSKAYTLPERQPLGLRREGDYVEVVLPRVQMHAMVGFE